jgi:hypothetical protein
MSELAVDIADGDWGHATATFSADRRHRYLLTRTWDATLPTVNFVMLNPSTADAFALDPTNRRCVGFARSWGFGSMVTTNVFAWRSTDPRGLRAADDPIGSANDSMILEAASSADLVVAAWGVHSALFGRGEAVRSMLGAAGIELHLLRLTNGGHPAHPLYLRGDTRPRPWRTVIDGHDRTN